jgi:hypothetical protein
MPSIDVISPDVKTLERVFTEHNFSTINLLKLAWSLVAHQFISTEAFQFQILHQQDAVSKLDESVDSSNIEISSISHDPGEAKSTSVADLLRANSGIASENGDAIQSVNTTVEEPVIPKQRIWSKLQIVLLGDFQLNKQSLDRRLKRIKEDSLTKVWR